MTATNSPAEIRVALVTTIKPLQNPTFGVLEAEGSNVLGRQIALIHRSQDVRQRAAGSMALRW